MSGRFLLDTNIVIDVLNGNEIVIEKLSKAEEIYICDIVIGELLYGAYGSRKKEANIRKIEDLICSSSSVDFDVQTARQYGILKSELKKQGTPIPDNDIWIAALALQYDLTILTRDRHFSNIPNGVIELIDV